MHRYRFWILAGCLGLLGYLVVIGTGGYLSAPPTLGDAEDRQSASEVETTSRLAPSRPSGGQQSPKAKPADSSFGYDEAEEKPAQLESALSDAMAGKDGTFVMGGGSGGLGFKGTGPGGGGEGGFGELQGLGRIEGTSGGGLGTGFTKPEEAKPEAPKPTSAPAPQNPAGNQPIVLVPDHRWVPEMKKEQHELRKASKDEGEHERLEKAQEQRLTLRRAGAVAGDTTLQRELQKETEKVVSLSKAESGEGEDGRFELGLLKQAQNGQFAEEDARGTEDAPAKALFHSLDGEVDDQKSKPKEPEATGKAGFFEQTVAQTTVDLALRSPPPTSFLPDTFYFENTYLGGDAGYAESLRRLDAALSEVNAPHRLAGLPSQGFDPPAQDGLGLTASLDHAVADEAGRVFLQVGLRGSSRYGWRRPPLEVVVILDAKRGKPSRTAIALVEALLSRLGPQDRLAVMAAGRREPLARLDGVRHHLADLLTSLDRLLERGSTGDVGEALIRAGELFADANEHRTTAPGTQVALLFTDAPDEAATHAHVASMLGLRGIVTSVIGLGSQDRVANAFRIAAAGNGNLHAVAGPKSVAGAVDAELDLLARVVARLVRVNVRLAPGVKVVRVLGSRPLAVEEVREVKERELETDRRLSAVLGIDADRGDDDDGIQTVIPVFHGGDSHVIVLELWAPGAGPVADVSIRYKDLVNLDNATARTRVELRRNIRSGADDSLDLVQNVTALEGSEALAAAATALDAGDANGAYAALARAPAGPAASYRGLLDLVARGELSAPVLSASLRLAARRSAGGGG